MNSVAVYTKSVPDNIEKISEMKDKFIDSDFFIFTDFFIQTKGFSNIGILSDFYMKFFKGTIYFLNEEEYNQHKDSTIATCILFEGS